MDGSAKTVVPVERDSVHVGVGQRNKHTAKEPLSPFRRCTSFPKATKMGFDPLVVIIHSLQPVPPLAPPCRPVQSQLQIPAACTPTAAFLHQSSSVYVFD